MQLILIAAALLAAAAETWPQLPETTRWPGLQSPAAGWPQAALQIPKAADSGQPKPEPAAPSPAGYWATVCEGGSCRRVWIPAVGGQPARSPVIVQPQQPRWEYRRGLFGRTYRVQVR